MIQIKDKKDCCGCSACSSICPQNCISMHADQEGFLYPCVNENECIGCDICESICPIQNPCEYKSKKKTFVCYTTDDSVRLNSSSGGMFTVIARKIFSQNGVVFGATFDDKYKVVHVMITDESQLGLLQGSKYVQSDVGQTFLQVKKCLREGRLVLYSGTACQIAGLKKYLGKEYENLLTIDVLCHGVPSPSIWEKYLEDKNIENIKEISFRHKVTDWREYNVQIKYYGQPDYDVNHNVDYFMRLFLSNASLRPSCHECKFKDINRPSDITLGDCWGIKKHAEEMDDGKGVSVMIVHNKKGINIFESIKKMIKFKELPLDFALSPEDDARRSVKPHANRKKIFKLLDKGATIEELVAALSPTLIQKIKRKLF